MKFIVVCLLFVCYANANVLYEYSSDTDPYIFENQINGTIQGIIDGIVEPIVVENLALDFPADGLLTGHFYATNLQVVGLKQLVISELKVGFDLSMDFTAQLGSLNINTNYDLDVNLANLIPLYGVGSANVHLNGLVIKGHAKAALKDTRLGVSELSIVLGLDTSIFDIHGLLNDEAFSLIVSAILNDNVSRFINEQQALITQILSPILQGIINGVLNGGGSGATTAIN